MDIRKNNEGHYTFNDKIYVDARLRNVKDAEKYEFADFITVDVANSDIQSFTHTTKKFIGFSKYVPIWPFLKQMVKTNFYGVQIYSDSIKHTDNLAPELEIILMMKKNLIMLDDIRTAEWPGETWKTEKAQHLIYT